MSVDASATACKNSSAAREGGRAVAEQITRDIGVGLSGGGYRAMLYHLGAVWRLNDAGLLPRIAAVSSVSGGSITAGVLGKAWNELEFDASCRATNLGPLVVDPIVEFSRRGVDVASVLSGFFIPGVISRRVVARYRRRLFHDATLGDLPDPRDGPRFVITATNLSNGALWYFSWNRVGDHRSGFFVARDVPLARAVAASSAFPPVLSPHMFDASEYNSRAKGAQQTYQLSDGGVYDNLGVEPLRDGDTLPYLLVSDGGAPFAEKRPPRTWLRSTIHVTKVIDLEVRKLRRRHLIANFHRRRKGALWTIDTTLATYADDGSHGAAMGIDDFLPVSTDTTHALATVSTRLAKLDDARRWQLVDWGYASADAALRKYTDLVATDAAGTLPSVQRGATP
jgi:NTE family protein